MKTDIYSDNHPYTREVDFQTARCSVGAKARDVSVSFFLQLAETNLITSCTIKQNHNIGKWISERETSITAKL